jgi:N-methylhydantoinase A/oxoprolinase/acetone carboxylase beta subunit
VWGTAPRLQPRAAGTRPARRGRSEIVFGGEALEADVLRGEPEPGASFGGPALLALPEATLLVAPGWSARVEEHGTIALRRERS